MNRNEFNRKRNALRRQVRSARLDAKRQGVFQGVHKVTEWGVGHIIGWADPNGTFRSTTTKLTNDIIRHAARPVSKDARHHWLRALRECRRIDEEMGRALP